MCVVNTTLILINLNSIPSYYSVIIANNKPPNCIVINLYTIQLNNIINTASAGLSHCIIVIMSNLPNNLEGFFIGF